MKMYMYNTFSSQPNLAQQATDGQHHKATTTLSLRFRKKTGHHADMLMVYLEDRRV